MSPKPQQRPASSGRLSAGAPRADRRGSVSRHSTPEDFQRLLRAGTLDTARMAPGARRRSPALGKLSTVLAVVSAAADASAFAILMGGDETFGFGICFVSVFVTFIAAVLGFIAAVGAFGRWYGVLGVVLAFVANPIVLVTGLVIFAPDVLAQVGAGS